MNNDETNTEFKGFYFSVKKPVEAMTIDECEYEIESYESYAERCREIGQGINSKEYVRCRMARTRLAELLVTMADEGERR